MPQIFSLLDVRVKCSERFLGVVDRIKRCGYLLGFRFMLEWNRRGCVASNRRNEFCGNQNCLGYVEVRIMLSSHFDTVYLFCVIATDFFESLRSPVGKFFSRELKE